MALQGLRGCAMLEAVAQCLTIGCIQLAHIGRGGGGQPATWWAGSLHCLLSALPGHADAHSLWGYAVVACSTSCAGTDMASHYLNPGVCVLVCRARPR